MSIVQSRRVGKDERKKSSKRSGVKTLQAAEPPSSFRNGPIKRNSENIGKWMMIHKIGLRMSILLNIQRKEKGADSRISRTRRIVYLNCSLFEQNIFHTFWL